MSGSKLSNIVAFLGFQGSGISHPSNKHYGSRKRVSHWARRTIRRPQCQWPTIYTEE